MTVIKSLSFKVKVIFFSIWLFVFSGYSKPFGAKRIYFCENPSTYCYFDQQSIVYTSKNIVRVWVKTVYKGKYTIEMGGKFGHLKRFSKSEGPKMILLIFIVGWGIAIISVLGAILYRIVIKPMIKKRKLKRNRRRQNPLNQNHQSQEGNKKLTRVNKQRDFFIPKQGQIVLLIGFCLFLYFFNLDRWDLWNPDEPRYAIVVREIRDSGALGVVLISNQ